jgi:hypothetical protein
MAGKRSFGRALLLWSVVGIISGACGEEKTRPRTSGGGDGDDPTSWVAIDTDGDGVFDGIDTDGDGIADIVGTPIDSDGDGIIDSLDTNGDGVPDVALPGFMLPVLGTGGAPQTGTGGGPFASICDRPPVRGGSELLIDDLEHEGESNLPEVDRRVGKWFIAADLISGATQTPPADAVYPTRSVGRSESFGFESTLSGFSGRSTADLGIGWGPQFGLTLNDQDGNLCAYDASAFDGVTFCAISADGETYTIDFAVPMLLTLPISRGGTCSGEGCGDVHSVPITVGPEWKCDYDIEWASLIQNRRLEHNNKYSFDPTNIVQLIWTSRAGDHHIVIDDVRFLGDQMGLGGSPGGAGGAP